MSEQETALAVLDPSVARRPIDTQNIILYQSRLGGYFPAFPEDFAPYLNLDYSTPFFKELFASAKEDYWLSEEERVAQEAALPKAEDHEILLKAYVNGEREYINRKGSVERSRVVGFFF